MKKDEFPMLSMSFGVPSDPADIYCEDWDRTPSWHWSFWPRWWDGLTYHMMYRVPSTTKGEGEVDIIFVNFTDDDLVIQRRVATPGQDAADIAKTIADKWAALANGAMPAHVARIAVERLTDWITEWRERNFSYYMAGLGG
ncbi:hypothetical protein ELE36_09725 [Pseudolysobacter antarcticus]|uniref:Uncharacterized protein n=1 Tax=Pseudolysobacter antarcticus TaxID=2511995 RepID=A0A411HJC0_9GAMM|nr:hypothetical protein [Pseudolysobacter antarcticus]QBB70622.1 hypothetical protein ELE36_09725 [Pseudolysobacter antarcticus]